MFDLALFDLSHAKLLLAQNMNQHLAHWVKDDYKFTRTLAHHSMCLTGLVDNTPMFCSFIVEIWNGRGYLVMVLSEEIEKYPVQVYRGMKRYLKELPFDRLEFDNPVGFELGRRRAQFLGFRPMCKLARKYLPDGADAEIFEWVRD